MAKFSKTETELLRDANENRCGVIEHGLTTPTDGYASRFFGERRRKALVKLLEKGLVNKIHHSCSDFYDHKCNHHRVAIEKFELTEKGKELFVK